jgi:hypothetical protein
MKRFIFVFLFLSAYIIGYSDTNTYNEYLQSIDAGSADVLIQALHTGDMDLTYGAIKRIGELKLTNARKDIYDWMAQSNPAANQGKEIQSQNLRNIFRICVWTLGQIGNETDAHELVGYLKDIQD